MRQQRCAGNVWELWANVWCLKVVLVSGVKNWLGMVVMKLKHSNKANQQSSLMCGTAKIDPHKLNCEIAFVACQQMERMCGFCPPPHPAHFTSVPPAFPFHRAKMHEYILNGRCRECRPYLRWWHLTKMAIYLCTIIDGFACFMRVRATLCWIFYQGGFSGHEKCLTGHLRCTNNLFWCKSEVAGSFRELQIHFQLIKIQSIGSSVCCLFLSTSTLYLHIFYSVHLEFG